MSDAEIRSAKRLWKLAACDALAEGRSFGWIDDHRAIWNVDACRRLVAKHEALEGGAA